MIGNCDPSMHRRWRSGCALVACVVLLAGCAAQSAFRAGNEMLLQGKTTEGLAKLEEATRLEPGSAEYRIGYIQAREREVERLLARADSAVGQGSADLAEPMYRQVLAMRPNHERATAGLRALENSRRWDQWLKSAEAAASKRDWDGARTKLRALLSESPRHAAALHLLRRIDEQTAKPSPETSLSAAYRKPISIEFKDAPLKTVFEVIARTSGLNFLFDKDVKGDQKTSIFLKNSTIEAAVGLTLLTNQLEQRVLDANTVLIYPNSQAKQKEYQPLTVRSFYLANADAKNVATSLKSLLKARDVVVDEKLNLLIVRDSPEAVRLAEKLVALHDVPDPEVMLEVEMLEVKRTRLLGLGVSWPDQIGLAPIASASGGTLTLNDLRNINGSTLGATISPLVVNAKKADSDANILANPRIRVRNREKAKILIGERVPNITTTSTSTGFVAESVSYVDIGLKLDVEPTIYLDDEVAIKVSLEVSNIINQLQTKSGSLAYQIGTRTATTVLRLRDGENQVLAGLISDEDRRTANKVPGLGEIPLVGRVFGTQTDDGSKTEIVLSITPRVLRNVQRPEASALEFESGTEASLRSRTAEAPSAAIEASAAAAFGAVVAAPGSPSSPGASAAAAAVASSATPLPTARTDPIDSSVHLRLEGPTRASIGEAIAVQVRVQSGSAVATVPLAIDFDPAIVQVTSINEGDFLKQGGAPASFTSRVDPAGQLTITGRRTAGGSTGEGVLATLNLRIVGAAPETSIRIASAGPSGPGNQQVPELLPQPHVIMLR